MLVRFQASQAPIHSALLKGLTTVMAALSPPSTITQATARQRWNFDTAPFLRGHIIRDDVPAPASPAHISILAALIQGLNEVRLILAFAEDFAIKRGALSQSLIGYSLILRQLPILSL